MANEAGIGMENTHHRIICTRLALMSFSLLEDDTVEALLEPRSGLLLPDTVGGTDTRLTALAAGNTGTRTSHADEEVHTENTDTRVVLDTQVNVLGDTETEVAGLREVALAELVLLDLQATLENLLSLRATDSDVAGDLLVTTDTETTESVASLASHRGLTGKLLKHLGGTSETVTRLTDRDVDDELVNLKLLFLLVFPSSRQDGIKRVRLVKHAERALRDKNRTYVPTTMHRTAHRVFKLYFSTCRPNIMPGSPPFSQRRRQIRTLMGLLRMLVCYSSFS